MIIINFKIKTNNKNIFYNSPGTENKRKLVPKITNK